MSILDAGGLETTAQEAVKSGKIALQAGLRGHQKTVTIIGAGPGGLAAAMLLAGSGLKVRILERSSKVGGRTTSIEGDGFCFDTGPTFFQHPKILADIFEAVGRKLEDEVPMTRLDPQYRLIFNDGNEILATPDAEKMERQIAAISPGDAKAFHRFMADNRIKLKAFEPCLSTPFQSWRDVVNFRMLKLLPLLRPHKSLEQDLGRYFKDPRIRLAFTFQAKYLGMSPFRCPSLFSILSFIEYEHGVYHPTGGCNAVTQAMARVARELGVEILLNEEVKKITFKGKRAVGVETANHTYAHDAIVINADFAHAMTTLVPNELRKKWKNERIAKKKYSCSTFMMYLGVEGSFPELPHHNIFIAGDYRRNVREIEGEHVLSNDASFYVENPSPRDPTLAPPGMSAMYVLAPVSHMHANIDWAKEKPRFRQQMIRQLSKLGIPDLEKRIRFERVVTPADWESKFAIYRGATFNLSHTLGQMLHLRPRNHFDELEGVYLVGGGTHPGSGLPVIFLSAKITTKLLLEKELARA